MRDNFDYFYTGSVFFGSDSQEMIMTFDTGSDMTVIESNFCRRCPNPVFDASSSSSFTKVREDLITK